MRRRPIQPLRPEGTGIPRAVVRSAALVVIALATALVPLGAAADSLPVTYTIDGVQGTNGWYRGSTLGNFVVVRWTINVPVVNDCSHAMKVDGPTAGATRSCTVTLNDGSTLTRTTEGIKIDADPPTGVQASASRAPDFKGWYNHPLGLAWTASDATSGIAGCTALTYSGPDGGAAPVAGGCTDAAGNTAAAPISLSYDATPPQLTNVGVASANGSDVVRWKSSSPADTVVIQRSARGGKEHPIVFRGTGDRFSDTAIQPGVEYTYALQSVDQAGNASRKRIARALPKVLGLRKSPYVPRAAQGPILRWDAVRDASYYHVQLFRGSKRILAAWPVRRELPLRAAWKWGGRRYHLSAGRYRWYVWAGLGRRSFARYRAIGHAQFIVPKR